MSARQEQAQQKNVIVSKRFLDLLIVIPALVLLAPVMAIVALLIRLTMGAPVFYRQQRPGLHQQPFTILKFRTMTDTRDAAGNLLSDVMRLTRLGKLLRRTSLDELPELINVLRGDMSLVGPRPLILRYLPYFTPREQKRFSVLPGVTGWAQVNGRNDLPWDERLACDIWYVENWSLFLDCKILALTLIKVLKRESVNAAPTVTMLDLDEERRRLQPLSEPS